MELTGELLTEVLEKADIVYKDKHGGVYNGFKENVDLTPYINYAAIDLKRRLNL